MIILTKEQIKILHSLCVEKTGGSFGIRDEEIVGVGMAVAQGEMNAKDITKWIISATK